MITIYLSGCILFFILSAFFSASEISYVSSNLMKLRHRRHKGDKRAKKVYNLIQKPERFLVTTLVGINVSMVLSTSFLTFSLISLGVKNSNLWITFIFTPVVVIFADLIPKNIGRFFREEFSCRTVRVMELFKILFFPFIYITELISNFIVKLFLPKVKKRSFFVTKEEIRSLVQEIQRQGGIDRGEKEAIDEVFEFRRGKIKDVCTFRKNIVGLDYTDSRQVIIDTAKNHNFTRYPVYRNKVIVGYLNIFDIFYNYQEPWQSFVRPISKVGFNQRLYEVFARLKVKKESMALVIKGKKVYGVVTLQDIITEITTSIVKA